MFCKQNIACERVWCPGRGSTSGRRSRQPSSSPRSHCWLSRCRASRTPLPLPTSDSTTSGPSSAAFCEHDCHRNEATTRDRVRRRSSSTRAPASPCVFFVEMSLARCCSCRNPCEALGTPPDDLRLAMDSSRRGRAKVSDGPRSTCRPRCLSTWSAARPRPTAVIALTDRGIGGVRCEDGLFR